MGFIMLKSSQAQITQLKNNLIVISAAYKSYVKSSELRGRQGTPRPLFPPHSCAKKNQKTDCPFSARRRTAASLQWSSCPQNSVNWNMKDAAIYDQ